MALFYCASKGIYLPPADEFFNQRFYEKIYAEVVMDTHLLPYRLKSARRKRRLVIEDRDKQLLKLDRKQHQIWNNPDYKTTTTLEEPYQKGWKRLFVLKPEVQQSDKAGFYQGILDEINEVQCHYDQSFKRPKRKGIWHKYIFKELPKLHSISNYHWHENRSKLNEEQRACFRRVDYWNQHYYRWEHHFEFTDLICLNSPLYRILSIPLK